MLIFTAAQDDYARKVQHALDPHETMFDHILSREHCLHIEKHRVFVKDLSLLLSGRDLKDIIIVDNRTLSYVINLENGIPIKDFYGDKSDKEMHLITKYIQEKLLGAPDVREVLKKDFLDHKVITEKRKLYNI